MNVKGLLLITTLVLIVTNTIIYALLAKTNVELKKIAKDPADCSAIEVAEALAEHVYYDGDSIPCNQVVKHYGRSGMLESTEEFSNVIQGEKVVMLLSSNCCTSCAIDEIGKLLELSKKIRREHLIVIADFALHMQSSWSMCFDKDGFYETSLEHMGLKGAPTRETPVVMLTQNGRIKTSFVVNPQTKKYADQFHNYLENYFKERK